jgi:hypothetical protein
MKEVQGDVNTKWRRDSEDSTGHAQLEQQNETPPQKHSVNTTGC